MSTRHQLLIHTMAAVLATLTADAAAAANTVTTRYGKWEITLTDLGALTPTGQSSAYSINELGEIVGTATDANGLMVRPIWSNGIVTGFLSGVQGTPYAWNSRHEAVGANVVNTKISCSMFWIPGLSGQLPPLPGGRSCATYAFDVNALGEMSGGAESSTPVLQTRPVTWRNGIIYRDLGMPPGARHAVGSGINDNGDVAGHMTDAATGRIDAFLYSNGQYTVLPPLPGPFATYAIDINNNGDVAGTSNGGVPVVWKKGAAAPMVLPVPAGRYFHQLWRMNDNGDVVGSVSAPPPAFYSGALWRNGEFIDLGIWPGGIEAYARGVNNA